MSVKAISWGGTTDGSGDAVVDSPFAITGRILKVEVEGVALTDSADFDLNPVTATVAGGLLLGEDIVDHADVGNAALNELYPRKAVQDLTGTTVNYAATFPIYEPFIVIGCKLRATIAAGGATKAFKVRVAYED